MANSDCADGKVKFVRPPRKENFPIVDPATGEVLGYPSRPRLRHVRLNENRKEVLDERPVASAVAFNREPSVEERMQSMMRNATAMMEARVQAALNSGRSFYDDGKLLGAGGFDDDDDDFSEVDNPIDSRYVSPHEFVYDENAKREVPRALQGPLKRAKERFEKKKKESATKVAPSSSPAPVASQSAEGGGESGE